MPTVHRSALHDGDRGVFVSDGGSSYLNAIRETLYVRSTVFTLAFQSSIAGGDQELDQQPPPAGSISQEEPKHSIVV